ncbi:hypothetical protein TRM7615_04821 [Falsiruegeria mediterranea M17]|uniref:Uncharacterized protein n=1 Tax=Falsiruegeria mediterranea M17 TaxID=1200281 RepID=A0A2R8CG93_9RHOB|nr:hypothetical protein TRM7615_04821 [Falsiruegeria mediterranea M17]
MHVHRGAHRVGAVARGFHDVGVDGFDKIDVVASPAAHLATVVGNIRRAPAQGVIAAAADQRINAFVAIKLVGIIATFQRVPAGSAKQRVRAGAAQQRIVPLVAGQVVGACATVHAVVAEPPEQGIGAAAAQDRILTVLAQQAVVVVACGDAVVAISAKDGIGPGSRIHRVIAGLTGQAVSPRTARQAVIARTTKGGVIAVTAIQRVIPGIALQQVVATATQQHVFPVGAADFVIGVRPRQVQRCGQAGVGGIDHLDLIGQPGVEIRRRPYRIAAATGSLDHGFPDGVHIILVVARAADHAVDPGATGQRVIARVPDQRVIARIALQQVVAAPPLQAVDAIVAAHFVVPVGGDQVDRLGAAHIDGIDDLNRIGCTSVKTDGRAHRIGAITDPFGNHVRGVFDHIDIVTRPTGQGVLSGAAIERVIAGAAQQAVIARVTINFVIAGAAQNRVIADITVDRVIARTTIDAVVAPIGQQFIITAQAAYGVVATVALNLVCLGIAGGRNIVIPQHQQIFDLGFHGAGHPGFDLVVTARIRAAFALVDHVIHVVDEIFIVARAAIHGVGSDAPVQGIVAAITVEHLVLEETDQIGLQVIIPCRAVDRWRIARTGIGHIAELRGKGLACGAAIDAHLQVGGNRVVIPDGPGIIDDLHIVAPDLEHATAANIIVKDDFDAQVDPRVPRQRIGIQIQRVGRRSIVGGHRDPFRRRQGHRVGVGPAGDLQALPPHLYRKGRAGRAILRRAVRVLVLGLVELRQKQPGGIVRRTGFNLKIEIQRKFPPILGIFQRGNLASVLALSLIVQLRRGQRVVIIVAPPHLEPHRVAVRRGIAPGLVRVSQE